MGDAHDRPVGVTFVEILLYLQALSNVALGSLYIVDRNDRGVQAQTGWTSDELALTGFTLLLAGFFVGYIAYDLGKGGAAAKWFVSVVAGLQLLAAIWGLLFMEGSARNDLAAQGLLAALILLLLHTSTADRFFERRSRS